MATGEHRYRLGCDIGGTFTDFVLLDDDSGEIWINKCLTTPGDPSDAVEQGIKELEGTAEGFVGNLDEVIHGNPAGMVLVMDFESADTVTELFNSDDYAELARAADALSTLSKQDGKPTAQELETATAALAKVLDAIERLQSQEERARFDDTTKCILCAACTTSCPTFWGSDDYLGPAALVNAHRFILDSRDSGASERLQIVSETSGLARCHTVFNCTMACPREIEITVAIGELKMATITGKLE